MSKLFSVAGLSDVKADIIAATTPDGEYVQHFRSPLAQKAVLRLHGEHDFGVIGDFTIFNDIKTDSKFTDLNNKDEHAMCAETLIKIAGLAGHGCLYFRTIDREYGMDLIATIVIGRKGLCEEDASYGQLLTPSQFRKQYVTVITGNHVPKLTFTFIGAKDVPAFLDLLLPMLTAMFQLLGTPIFRILGEEGEERQERAVLVFTKFDNTAAMAARSLFRRHLQIMQETWNDKYVSAFQLRSDEIAAIRAKHPGEDISEHLLKFTEDMAYNNLEMWHVFNTPAYRKIREEFFRE